MKHRVWALAVAALVGFGPRSSAQEQGSISGTVVDPLGAAVSGAAVTLLRDGQRIADMPTGARGEFAFQGLAAGRYQVGAQAAGFEAQTTNAVFVGAGGHATVDVNLQIGPLRQEVVVTAAATEIPVSQIGAAVTVVDRETIENLAKPDVLEALRVVPGAQIVQTGQRGGVTAFFVRGGASNFNKVLIDGVAANDIGGAFDFSDVATTGVDRIEVLRESNSVLHGTDALSGVVSITTRRGRSRIPEFSYSLDGGNLGTVRQAASIGGAVKRFDYFSEYSHFQTDNNVPNNAFRTGTYAGRFGVALGSGTDVNGTVRRADTTYESPNGADLYGLADDSSQTKEATYAGLTALSQITDRWQSTVRFGSTEQRFHFVNPAPTGEPFDPFGFGPNYLGNAVTIRGANGFSASGRAILDFGGSYPSVFDASTSRQSYYGQTAYQVHADFDIAGGVRVEHEDGFTLSGTSRSATNRNNAGSFVEGRGTLAGRQHVTAGVGFEHNAIFGFAATPRLSVASYLRNPSSTSAVGDTKVTFNVGKGIKAPSISQELSSLFALVRSSPQAATLGVEPIGPERNRSLDLGVEQGLWQGRVRVRAAFFHNEFSDLIEFVSKNVLPQVGVGPAVAAATSFGAYVNSQSYRARGLETSADLVVGRIIRLAGSYTYLDAVVAKSFSSGALAPAINPASPGIQIGQFSPLVGARPFQRPTHSGSVLVTFVQGPAQVSLAGYFSGKQDDSTFLSDGFFGNSLLLPNHDLDAAYQKVDLSGSYRVHPRLRWYASIENILDQRYYAAFGFPALPRAARTGVTVALGGNR